LSGSLEDGNPKQNNGKFVGVFADQTVIVGGRVLYSSPRNVSNRGKFEAVTGDQRHRLNFGGIPPAWDDQTVVMVNYQHGALTCCEASQVQALLAPQVGENAKKISGTVAEQLSQDDTIRWGYSLGRQQRFEVLSLAVCAGDVVAVLQHQQGRRAQPEWSVAAWETETGKPRFQHHFSNEPLPGGLLVDHDGRVVVVMLDGSVLCYGS
jgi:hypothetical protein